MSEKEKKETGRNVFAFGMWSALVWWVASGVGHANAVSAVLGTFGFIVVFGLIGGGIGLYRMGMRKANRD